MTTPGAELLLLFSWEVLTEVAEGLLERVLTVCIRMISYGRLGAVVVAVVFEPGLELGPVRDGLMVRESTFSIALSV